MSANSTLSHGTLELQTSLTVSALPEVPLIFFKLTLPILTYVGLYTWFRHFNLNVNKSSERK